MGTRSASRDSRIGAVEHHDRRDGAAEALDGLRIVAGQDEVVGEGADALEFGDGELPPFERVNDARRIEDSGGLGNRRAGKVERRLDEVEILLGLLAGLDPVPLGADGVARDVGLRAPSPAVGDLRDRVPDRVAVGERLRVDGVEAEVVADADEDRPLPRLRDAEPLGVEDFAGDAVAARLQLAEDVEEVALGDALDEAGDVLGDEGPGPDLAQEPGELEEQIIGPLRLVAVLLDLPPAGRALPGRREGGARRRAVEEVEFAGLKVDGIEDLGAGDLADVAAVEDRVGRGVGAVGVPGGVDELGRPQDAEPGHAVAERRAAGPREGADDVEPVPGERADLLHRGDAVGRLFGHPVPL
jgi:hypothetical protein